MKQLVAFGAIRHAALQLTVQDLDPETAKIKGVSLEAGALVIEIPAGSSAERAGIKAGDIIAAVDDEPVANAEQLKRRIWELPAKTTVTLTVVRNADTGRFKAIVATTDRTVEQAPGTTGTIHLADDPHAR
jgi:S1-C subfamily serine protease